MRFTTRAATVDDVAVLWAMLYHAAFAAQSGIRDPDALRRDPDLARYVEGWGQPTDLGRVAVDDETDDRVGAAWVRLLAGDRRGYGYVDDKTPELTIAVAPDYRGRGIGERLLRELLDVASTRFRAVSLSVRAGNPAQRLYERIGFRVVGAETTGGAAEGGSITMRLVLPGSQQPRQDDELHGAVDEERDADAEDDHL